MKRDESYLANQKQQQQQHGGNVNLNNNMNNQQQTQQPQRYGGTAMNSRSGSSSVPNLDNKSQGQNVISPPPPTQPPTIVQQQQQQQAQLSNHQQQYPGKTVPQQYQTNGQSMSIPTLNKSIMYILILLC